MKVILILLAILVMCCYCLNYNKESIVNENFEDDKKKISKKDDSKDKIKSMKCEFVSVDKANKSCPVDLPINTGAVIRNINGELCSRKPPTCKAISSIKDGKVKQIDVVNSSNGFNSLYPPKVIIKGGGGKGAKATAVIKNKKVEKIKINDRGSQYTHTPTIKIVNTDPTSYCKLCCSV